MADEKILEQILAAMQEMKQDVKDLKQDVKNLKQDTDLIKIQQKEHGEILRALVSASEEHKSQIDNLAHTVARVEGEVKEVRKDLTNVEIITSSNWNDIAKLKAVK